MRYFGDSSLERLVGILVRAAIDRLDGLPFAELGIDMYVEGGLYELVEGLVLSEERSGVRQRGGARDGFGIKHGSAQESVRQLTEK